MDELIKQGVIVKKVGNVHYWEDRSKDVAEIAQQHMMRIKVMLEDTNSDAYHAFQKFMLELHHNINNSISEQQVIEMLAQHLITKPVFETLFDSYSFVNHNPVSQSMDAILAVMDEKGLMKEQEGLEKFYESVRIRASEIDNLEAKQNIIIQLYEKFFKVGFKETTERLGIAFTPIEIVDFIIYSVEDILQKHFKKSVSNENVHILDPFTGTGTFIVRLLQSGLIKKEDLLRKYTQELHANEIILLSYYIASINIEETFHSLIEGGYQPFEGIILTDTFESTEREDLNEDVLFYENSERLKRQQEPIFVIIGNPPYSTGQNNENENNKNQHYPILEQDITNTYAKNSKAKLKQSLYDSYVKAFKWASRRIEKKGIIGFVTNGSFIDSQSMDGLRKCWQEEFNYIYVFNLRGNQRTQGEKSRQEGGQIFGSMCRTPIAITLLVKDGSDNHKIYYHDIGNYLSCDDKLKIISDYKSVTSIDWQEIIPDKHNDWINQRDDNYDNFIPLYESIFCDKLVGVSTSRDAWVYGYSQKQVVNNSEIMVMNFNSEIERLKEISDRELLNAEVNTALNFINWSTGLKNMLFRKEKIELNNRVISSMYRPFVKKWMYYDKQIIERPGRSYTLFGDEDVTHRVIHCTGIGAKRDFSCIITNTVPNYDMMEKGQGFYWNSPENDDNLVIDYSNISQSAKDMFCLSEDEIFYYVYGVLHSFEYRQNYANDLQKSLPRIPILKNKKKYIEVGRKLADLHLNYESVPPYEGLEIIYKKSNPSYKVTKMKHPKKGVFDTIIFNSEITIKNIPEKAYEYVVNGRSAIGWIMDQYQVKTDKKSGITDDPNLYSDDKKYIFNLLLSIINVSVQTVDLVNSLPPLEIEE